jgi:antitoxin (DNA-binding transcriptional repressor) of toxin-antitoxin stability system
MKEIDFSEFTVKCSAIVEQVRKTLQPIRVMRLGEPLADIVPLSPSKNEPGAERLREKSPRASRAPSGAKARARL